MTAAGESRKIDTMPAASRRRQPAAPACPALAGPAVRALLRRAHHDAAPDVARCGGRYGLFVEPHDDPAFVLPTPNLHTCIRVRRQAGLLAGDLLCDELALPLTDAGFALVFLAFAFEAADDAVGIAAEYARLLEPEGSLLVLGLNPFSPAHLRWMFGGLRAWSPPATAALAAGLGLEVVGWRYLGARWSGGTTPAIDVAGGPAHGSPLRSAYLLEARRRDPGLTPLRLTPARVRVGGGAPAGSASVPPARVRSRSPERQ